MLKQILDFFERIENKIRARLSRYPIIYAIIGGVGVVLFWRGIWHTADDINMSSSLSLLVGFLILLVVGLLVYEFIGSRLIISGLIGEEKIAKKEESEIKTEETELRSLQNTLSRLEKKLEHIDKEIEEK
jgi:uncharacterized membrane protein